MVCLIGEQPMPNLLGVRQENPDDVLLVYTDKTKEHCRRLKEVLRAQAPLPPRQLDPYDIRAVESELERALSGYRQEGGEVTFNVSGGTKPMAFGALRLAERWRCPFVYVESREDGESEIHRYGWGRDGNLRPVDSAPIRLSITIDEYLKAHLGDWSPGGYSPGDGGIFEKAVVEALTNGVDEIVSNVRHREINEIDLVWRRGNRLAVAEVKLGKKVSLQAVQQLNLVCRPEHLGTYTRKFLIVGSMDPHAANALELARATGIHTIEFPTYEVSQPLSADDGERLCREVRRWL